MLIEMENSLIQLELIDTLQRLGVSYRFEDEINTILKEKYINMINNPNYNNLYVTALEFRLLRQHGYAVPQEIFNHFKEEIGKIKANMISDDIMEVLALYEASFYEKKGESILEEVRIFTTQYLKNYIIMISQERKLMIDNDNDYDYDIEIVNHALELPLHRRTTRTEAKWFIDAYEKKQDMNPILLEFAKLDFNMIQSTHHDDLKHIFRWWRHTKLGENLNFARDRLMECFLWKIGIRFEPKFSYFRITTAKLFELITVIDDIYDVYGTLDELELFTKAIERWDMEMINELPEYMKMPYIVLHNTINEMVFEVLRDQHISINIQYLKKTWVDMCRGFLQEAKWYYSGYTPTLEEYIKNGWISVGAPVLIVHAYFSHANYNHTVTSSKEIFECFEHGYYPAIIRHSAIILRLTNDLATSSEELKRGDAPTSIQCYMQEKKVSEEKAREHIKFLISEIWKEMNNDVGLYPISLIEDATNFAKMGFFMYQHGDEVNFAHNGSNPPFGNGQEVFQITKEAIVEALHLTLDNNLRVDTILQGILMEALTIVSNAIIDRRSANFEPSIWSFDYIQSLTSQYKGEPYTSRVKKLERDVKKMLVEMENSLAQLELIDTLQRLGISYQIFNQLKDEIENIKKHINGNDIMGVLALYEASFYEKKGESILKEARIFTTKCLKNYTIMISEQKKLMIDNDYDYDIEVVNHALELPLHRRTTRTEAKWFIDAYAKKQDMNPMLLELAKLDFNIVQSTHHEDLKHIFRWWRHTKLGEKLNFARDRLMECFLWNIGIRFESKFSYFRTKTAKLFELVTFIDDIYDVYGTLDELELFTKAVERLVYIYK
ncbi:hypothetical protein F8388_024539 [Cannabis sativa]|uniref:Terpene synthase n=1 Tax=Cannabis sativa TaxID=3483 RepID=A0A7J6GBB4_CANSA|nr:hypothetical protein F8388_024539 [Cannabis sativa]